MTDQHGGIEKNANKFAESFIRAYKKFAYGAFKLNSNHLTV